MEIAARWWGPTAITVAALVMLWWTWGTWPDVLVDFGAQLYIPWQLSEGKVLYRDIAYFGGPLSQYFNAAVFTIFGVGLWKLVACNLCILAVLIVLMRWMLCQVAARWAADVACLVFVLMFAFAQVTNAGGYNYVCPYTHESTHGLVLLLAALAATWQVNRWGVKAAAIAGLATGLAFLTKSEVFLGGFVGIVSALSLLIWRENLGLRKSARILIIFFFTALAPPTVAFLLLWWAMPASQALAGTLGSWVVATNSEVRNLPFFRAGMGTDDVAASLRSMGLASFWYAAAFSAAFAASILTRRINKHVGMTVAFVVAGLALIVCRPWVNWDNAARPFPALLLAGGGYLAWQLFRNSRADAECVTRVKQISLVIFAIGLLAKMMLNARVFQYGFVLAMPAMMVIVVALLDWLPTALERYKGRSAVFAAAMLGLLTVVVGDQLVVQHTYIDLKTYQVATGTDAFWSDARGKYVNAMLNRLATLAAPGETLTTLPEGIMLNYLSRRVNPTRYTNYMPTEVYLFGEAALVADFKSHPPDWLILIDKDTSEFGFRYFGRDYASSMRAAIERNFLPMDVIGDAPFKGGQFGLMLWRRTDRVEK